MLARITAIRAPHGSQWFEADFSDGWTGRLPNRILRGYCPCAGCQGHGGELAFREGDAELVEIHTVGRYAIQPVWGDRHQSGIYPFDHIRKLCELYAEHGDELPVRIPSLTRMR